MPSFVNQLTTGVIRKDPLGPGTLNQLQANVVVVDGLMLSEHSSDGQHNALEIPWVLGAVNSGTTGYLFDTAYGGTTIARPATGRATISVVSGVVGESVGATGSNVPAAAVLANVSDSAIATYPHVIETEMVSLTSIEVRTRYMTSTLGSPGNAWAAVAVGFDVALHAQAQPVDTSGLSPYETKRRRDFLTEAALDWNTLVQNQGKLRKALSLEHSTAGLHDSNRIARGWGRFAPSAGPAFSIVDSEGVSSVTRLSAGVVRVRVNYTLSSTNLAACFPRAQPNSADELVIVNGRCTATNEFTFYIYVYSVSENNWTRDDRAFSAVMFGDL